MEKNRYNAIVVGGGIAGLTSAVYLARDGQKVLLIEKNKECGGLVNTFSRQGFQFEAGVRALEDAGVIFPMLKDLGIHLDVVKSTVSLGIADEIMQVKDMSSLDEYKQMLKRQYPGNDSDIDHFLKVVKRVMKHMEVLYGVENPAFKDLKRDKEYIFKKLLPWLPRFIFTVRKINRMNMPVEEYLEEIIKDRSLRDIISQHFFKNTPSFFALSYFSLYLDYFYPMGGVGKLAEALHDKILEYGGSIKNQTEITAVNPSQGSVEDTEGESYSYDNMIWAADLKTFYQLAGTEGLSAETAATFEQTKSEMNKGRGGDSVFSLYLLVDEPLESFANIASGHFFYTPSKEGLGETHRSELNELLENWEAVTREKVLEWLDRFTQLNTFEISIPGLKDPSLVPPGKSGVIISLLAEYDLFNNIANDGWYKEFKTELEERIIQVITDSVYPMLKEKVISRFSFTPLGIKDRVGSSEGAITGWSFEKHVPVVHKMQYSDKSVLTPIPNIFQAGQWAFSPAGVPMSILTGKLAADRVIKKAKKQRTK